jgi:hypothetical protein
MALGTGFSPVDRVGAGERAPLFARTLAASKMAEDQSISPRLPSRSRIRRCSRGHSPACVQAVNRRCAVGADTPNDGGRCRQAHPLVNTNTIAVNTARSSIAAVGAPPCGRGTNGATSSHSPSGTRLTDR